jgi:large subunit ribosomal protein L29
VKAEKLRDMTGEELRAEEAKLVDELFKLRIQKATSQLENPQRLKTLRRSIARVKTVIRVKELEKARREGR